jgi:hypothetical protein
MPVYRHNYLIYSYLCALKTAVGASHWCGNYADGWRKAFLCRVMTTPHPGTGTSWAWEALLAHAYAHLARDYCLCRV